MKDDSKHLDDLQAHWEGKIRDLNDRIKIAKRHGWSANLETARACYETALLELKIAIARAEKDQP